MVKFSVPKDKFKKKTKKDKAKAPNVSPLMADDDDDGPLSSSSDRAASRATKDARRKKERAERKEKREQRDKRLEDSAQSKSSSKKDKKSKPKLSREERDLQDSKLGCRHKFAQILVKIIHLVDGIIGFVFVIYGLLCLTKFQNPAMEAVITSLTFGSALLFTAIMGVVGFYSSMCSRIGLAISAYMGPFIAFFYLFVIIALLSSSNIYFDYLTEHKDVLYLNDAEILTLKKILPFFYIAMASLAAVEICRFLVLREVRHTLVKFDAANERISSRVTSGASKKSKSSKSKGSKTGSKHSSSGGGSNRTNLTEPLLDRDEEVGGGNSSSEDSDW